MGETDIAVLIGKLDHFIRKYYKNQLIRGGLYSLSAVLLFYILITVLEYYAHFTSATRMVLFYGFIGSVSYILGRWVAVPLFRLFRLSKGISHEHAATLIGRHFPDVQDKLTNTLELQEQLALTDGQKNLVAASIDQRIAELRPVPFGAAIDLSENRKHLRLAIPPVMALLVIVFAAPSILTDGTERLVNHRTEFAEVAPFTFVIENDALRVGQQEDFDLKVRIKGDVLPDDVYIEIENNQFRLQEDNAVSFRHTFRNIQDNVAFRLYADGFYSEGYELIALPNPLLLNFDIKLDYPAYTGRTDEVLKNTGDMVIPAGTKVVWDFTTQNTESALIRFEDGPHPLERTAANSFQYSEVLLASRNYSVTTRNEHMQARDSILYAINVIPDRYPGIEVDEKSDTASSKRVYFRGMVKDDYGFRQLTFNYRLLKSASEEARSALPMERIELSIDPNTTQTQFFHFWNFEDLDIQAGDEVEYYFEVWDNDAINGSKSARSQKRVFRAPTLDELAERAEAHNKSIKEDLEQSIRDAKELQEEMERLSEKLLEKKNISWEEKKQLKDLLEKQQNLENQVNDIRQENQENQREQNEYNPANEELLEKQRQLEELFEQVMTDEMKEMFDELEQLMDQLNKDKLQEALEEMQLTNEDIEKELDRTLEIFKQLEFEQKLDEVIEKLDELAEDQQELSEETDDKQSDEESLSEKQEELQQSFEDLKKDLDDLQEKNEALEFPNEMNDTEQQEQSIDQEMQNSQQQLQQNKKKKASQSQQNAADQMEQLSQDMKQMQQNMQQQGQQEDLNALRQLLENLVQLSFDQEDLMLDLKGTNTNDPKYNALTQQQKKLKDDAQMLEDSLFALSKRNPQIHAAVNREMASINSNMEKSISLMSDQPPGRAFEYIRKAGGRQQLVMTSVNNLALLLDEVVQQMQQAMSQQQFGKASCNKPGQKQNGQQQSMTNMKQMQQQLNKQIEQLRKQMEKNQGKNPGGKGGMGSKGKQGKLSKDLAKMAAEQEAIRNELRKLSEQLGKDGENGGGQNGLEELSRMMEETETDLVNKRITLETIQRQQEIMTRMLESEKAEKERELDNKRESKEAENELFADPSELFEYKDVKRKEIELLKTVPPSLNSFYKTKVNEYFNGFQK